MEINDELLSFVAVQMNIDSERISDYASWQHTVSEHQARKIKNGKVISVFRISVFSFSR